MLEASSAEDARLLSCLKTASSTSLDQSLQEAVFSPIKGKKVSKWDKDSYGKRKAVEVQEAVISQLATCLKVPTSKLEDAEEACKKCGDLDMLTEELKKKFTLSESMPNKLSLLTPAPHSWTIEKTVTEFGASSYMVKKARAMKKNFGILPDHSFANKGKELSKETVEKVTAL